ncbi:Clusterin-associated protein 1 [Aphelenchoides fujianensis]|nr:Clusterin-associated protein 1 [Aphelenchoides fujianensis]
MEILRALHYPRLVSIENFRLPNFPLMAEILEWMVKKFDPNYRIPKSIETEAERVLFVKSCVLALIQKARVKLNPKSLYQRQDVRVCIQNTMEIPKTSATLYDLLAKEILAREARLKALSQSLNVRDVEQILRKMIAETNDQQADFRTKLDSLASDEQTLDRKIEQRQREYDQLQKRLAKLQSLRPPYMDEYENYESQLKGLYREYVIQFRNLVYLQGELEKLEKEELARSHEAERSMRLAVEKMRHENEQVPPLSNTNFEEVKEKVIKVYGNMTGGGLSDDDEEDESEEMNDLDAMNIHDMDVDSNEDDEELLVDENRAAFAKRRESQRHPPPANQQAALNERSDKDSDSDDNF